MSMAAEVFEEMADDGDRDDVADVLDARVDEGLEGDSYEPLNEVE